MMEKMKYPIGPEHYTPYEEVGQGVSASVHRALCKPVDAIVAIKILDFERDNCDLNNISREAQTMILVDHPNVLKSHCSFVSDHNLWVVMPFMSGGSCLHILKAAYPDGFEEVVIATILREILKGLEYLHHHGHIHRDVKAGNILIDSRGAIKLGDFGVSACLFDSGDRQRMRNTFVGTPCWMAPEVMEQLHGYDFKADIWSFGITALELAHGHAPFSKYPPMKVLLMTLQNAPPGLDYERDRKFSKSFKQMIASCLVKDPSKRPSAKKLLKHSFFKQARSNDYIARTLLEGLPALGDRIKELKRKEEYMLAQKKMPDGQKEELSQNEYKRGISGWNFNLDDMKAQASLIQDADEPVPDNILMGTSNSLSSLDAQQKQSQCHNLDAVADTEDNDMIQNQQATLPLVDTTLYGAKVRSDKSDDDSSIASSSHEPHLSRNSSPRHDDRTENNLGEKPNVDKLEATAMHKRQCSSGSSGLSEVTDPLVKGESDKFPSQPQSNLKCNAAVVPQLADDTLAEVPPKASKSPANNDELDEKAKVPVVQQKGRFKVTSENVDLEKVAPAPILQKSHSLQVRSSEVISMSPASPLPSALPSPLPSPLTSPSDATPSAICGYFLFPLLNAVLQTNIIQRASILSLMKQAADFAANRAADGGSSQATNMTEKRQAALEREAELLNEIIELQRRLMSAQDELQKLKVDTA
ncbi:PREDICTED: serine/threonine-kinase [Prunus dulcis]|uniref:PREDICTED: serine/threonine-kinase n=2 Tax=Prunus dulcis TaxID=3755 RepID=A0A5E4FS25_PRUDU|nr:serine/threonine-protein kinase OSR1 isoform X1 [Prunus dulcis]XP_034208565.1 serine/threonine-protein kinase OSR1 isoform X1 [Prunus dulcis]XP_034208566.1 serine/threonine-protein kinase OSR1 isoform X1 [Prunus dulcis]VVA30292.1 PREDICTED: serine/threonine-kinase [Prunus dulcis]